MKSSVQEAIANEHTFAATGGANTGAHLKGSARAHYGTQSQVSSGDTDGRLMITSDTSRLFSVASSTSAVLLGSGPRTPSFGSFSNLSNSVSLITYPQRYYVAMEMGVANIISTSGAMNVAFPNSGFSAVPQVFFSVSATTVQDLANIIVAAIPNALGSNLTVGGFSALVTASATGSGASGSSIGWLAIGPRIL